MDAKKKPGLRRRIQMFAAPLAGLPALWQCATLFYERGGLLPFYGLLLWVVLTLGMLSLVALVAASCEKHARRTASARQPE